MGLTRPRQGSIAFQGRNILGAPPYRIARMGIGLVPEGRQVFPTLTVHENLVATAYRGERIVFGREYLIPKPFDLRLLGQVASSVARVAMETGVARRPIADLDAYRNRLDGSVFRSSMLMKPVFEAARSGSRDGY